MVLVKLSFSYESNTNPDRVRFSPITKGIGQYSVGFKSTDDQTTSRDGCVNTSVYCSLKYDDDWSETRPCPRDSLHVSVLFVKLYTGEIPSSMSFFFFFLPESFLIFEEKRFFHIFYNFLLFTCYTRCLYYISQL